jgi:hypothetical protein
MYLYYAMLYIVRHKMATMYRIVRMYADRNKKSRAVRGKNNMTLAEAQAHCRDPKTKGIGWFDGYEEMKQTKSRRR